MRKVSRIFFCLLLLGGVSNSSFSGVFSPSWRGQEKTVYAEWDKWNGRTLDSGDMIFTPDKIGFGSGARKNITVRAFQESSLLGSPAQVFSDYLSHSDVLKLNTDGLVFTLPNFVDEAQYTLLRLEICYESAYASLAGFQVWGLTESGPISGYNGVFITSGPLVSVSQDGWRTEVYEFTIEPSPEWEYIGLVFSHYPALPTSMDAPYIDYLSIDTICIPEPAGLFLLAAGAAFLSRARR